MNNRCSIARIILVFQFFRLKDAHALTANTIERTIVIRHCLHCAIDLSQSLQSGFVIPLALLTTIGYH